MYVESTMGTLLERGNGEEEKGGEKRGKMEVWTREAELWEENRGSKLATGQFCAQANEAVASPESNRKVEGDHAFDQPTRSDEQQPASAR